MKTIFYYQPIIKPIANNGSERFGVNLITKIWEKDKPDFKAELTIYGKTTKEAQDKLEIQLIGEDKFKAIELECDYYICSQAVVDFFKPFEISKPFKDYIDLPHYQSETCYVAWLNFDEVGNHYKEEIEDKDCETDFWCWQCVPGQMDVSKISLKNAKKIGLFAEIENRIGLTKESNRAMTIFNLAKDLNLTPVELINKKIA